MIEDPNVLADQKLEYAREYAKLSDELGTILSYKPAEWLLLRGKNKSDASTDRAFELTEMGNREVVIKLKLKALEKMISAASTKITVLTNQSFNTH